jgi:hypothetical protein
LFDSLGAFLISISILSSFDEMRENLASLPPADNQRSEATLALEQEVALSALARSNKRQSGNLLSHLNLN